ncbi:MAG: aminotransferase class V-fold PLP-dependent enzyme [Demequinaceae bacterium]|nr:aminotransferase class V-fold PLP-dependent enzyme [Demequinaceae bacterium]
MDNPDGRRVFLDASGSAPMTPRTKEAFLAAIDEGWADPERLHHESRRSQALIDGAREAIAAVLRSPVERTLVVPTFGLAFDRAIAGIAAARRGRTRIVASAIERRPLLRIAHRSSSAVSLVPVDDDGRLDLEAFVQTLSGGDVSLVAVQHTNQEIGVIQRLERIHALATEAHLPLVVDATASIGHIDPPRDWDALVADPCDWGSPRGIAVLAFGAASRWSPVGPVVAGKVNPAVALAAAVALEEREEGRVEASTRMRRLTDRLRHAIHAISGAEVFGDSTISLPHVLSVAFDGVDGEALAAALDREGFAVGSGSACTTEPSPQSHVLAALGTVTLGNLRIGLHPGITDADVDSFVAALRKVLAGELARRPRG